MSPNFWYLNPLDARDWPPLVTSTNAVMHQVMAVAAVDATVSLAAMMPVMVRAVGKANANTSAPAQPSARAAG